MDECCMSRKKRERYRIHKKIESQLRMDRIVQRRELTMLLQGTAESGKSTIIRQMRLLLQNFPEEERKGFTKPVFHNIFIAVKALINAMKTLQIPFTDSKNTEYAEMISSIDVETVTTMEAHYAEAIKSVWSDHGMQRCYERRREFRLLDSAKYFLDDMDRIASALYLPTNQDILQVRVPTNGVMEYPILCAWLTYRMIDVGGQRSEVRKWIHCFENVTSIIFVAALSDYDQVLSDIPNENRMEQSLALFKTTVTCPWFQNTSIILILNKTDLLQEKIYKSHLVDYFPAYQGPLRNTEAAMQFILKMYEEQKSNSKPMYKHFTCATHDRDCFRLISGDVKDAIMVAMLNKYGSV